MSGEIKPLRRGDFGWRTLNGVCNFAPAGLESGETLFGLPYQFVTLYGTLRADHGTTYTLTRRITRGDGGRARLILQRSTADQPHFSLCPEGRSTARAIQCRRTLENGSLNIKSDPAGADQPFEISFGTQMRWREEGLLNLSGPGIGPGLQYYMPHDRGGLVYVSHYYLVEGEVQGERVRGFLCADDTYKPDVTPSPEQKHSPNPLVEHRLGVAIFNWANHYPAGDSEIGLFAIGHHSFGVGLYANTQGNAIATPLIDGEVHTDGTSHVPTAIDFDLEGRRWTFVRDQRGTMPGIASDALELDGVMHSPEGRQPDVWFCWGQSFPANGLRPVR